MKQEERLVGVAVTIADDNHCSNNCTYMAHAGGFCLLFQVNIQWNKRRKANGYVRSPACMGAELVNPAK